MMSQNWEVAGKNKSKQKVLASNGSATSKKTNISSIKPLETTQTLFEVFNKDQKENQKENNKDIIKEDEIKKKKISKPTAVKSKQPHTPKSLIDAITNFERDELIAIYHNDRDVFPNNSFIWLKDLATYISNKLDVQQIVSFTYSDYPQGFPLKQFTCQKEIHDILKECSFESLEQFVYDFFDIVVKDANKDNTIQGYKLLVQAILIEHPEIILDNPEKIIKLLKSNQNKPQICLSLIWIVGQIGFDNIQTQFVVWCKLMLPFIHSPNLAKYIINHIETIFSTLDLKQLNGLIDADDFFQLFDFVFSPATNIREEYRNRLKKLYPKFKAMVFCNKCHLQTHFVYLLDKLRDVKHEDEQYNEIMDLLVTCLRLDNACFKKWQGAHQKYLNESCLFLSYLHNNWSSVCKTKGLDTKLLLRTIDALQSDPKMGEGSAAQGPNKKSIEKCNKYITLLKKKRSWGFFKMFIVNFILLLTAATVFLIYDTNRPDPENSYVVWFYDKVDELGYREHLDLAQAYADQGLHKLLGYCHQAKLYYDKSLKPQLQPHLEKYGRMSLEHVKRVLEATGPYVEQGKQMAHVYLIRLQETTIILYEKVKPYCDRKYLEQIGDHSKAYVDELSKFIRSLIAKF